MYQIDEKQTKVDFNELVQTKIYVTNCKYNDELFSVGKDIENYIGEENESYILNSDSDIIKYTLEMYHKKIDLKMVQNSIIWAIINIDNLKKAELELLYKTVIANKLRENENENTLILDYLKDKDELLNYIFYTQSIDDYMYDKKGKQKVLEHLRNY